MDDFDEIVVPRKVKHIDKRKRHGRGFNEQFDHLAARKARVGFKQYIREMEEANIEDDFDDFDEEDETDEVK